MENTPELDEMLVAALKLSRKQRLQLAERIVSSVEREIEVTAPSDEHWGKSLNRLLDTLDTSDWEAMKIDDPVEWLKQQREEQLKQRLGDWGADE